MSLLTQLYKDLAKRSDGETLDKANFHQMFPLPVFGIKGLIGERLFSKFDHDGTNDISFEKFLIGISICCRGPEADKIGFLFSVYDLNGDNFIDKSELIAMVFAR